MTQMSAEKKSAEICEISGRKKKKSFPQITQINAEKESAEICEISGRKKQKEFPADNGD